MYIKLVFIDTETTGTDPACNGIHQLSMVMELYDMVKKERRIIEQLDLRIRPFDGTLYDEEALKVSKVTREEIEGYPPEYQQFKRLRAVLDAHCNKFDKKDKYYFIGYNVHFDRDFLLELFRRNGEKYFFSYFYSNPIDVMTLTSMLTFGQRPEMPNYQLGTVTKTLIPHVGGANFHNANDDISVTRDLFWKCVEKFVPETFGIDPNKLPAKSVNNKLLENTDTESCQPLSPVYVKKNEVVKWDDKITFGKYRNQTYREISNKQASYILWLNDNSVKDLHFSDEMLQECRELAEKQTEEYRSKMKEDLYKSPDTF